MAQAETLGSKVVNDGESDETGDLSCSDRNFGACMLQNAFQIHVFLKKSVFLRMLPQNVEFKILGDRQSGGGSQG